MPRYRFIGAFERVLHGLSHGVNAELIAADPETAADQPLGSTVVARPGDEISTTEPYPHPELVNTDTGEPDPPDVAGAFAQFEAGGQAADRAVAALKPTVDGAQQQDEASDTGEQAGTDPTETNEGA